MVNNPITGLLIGVFVSAVLVITFRRKTHKAVEIAAWIGLVGACTVAVIGIRDPHAHALTTSAAWGTSQVVGTIAGAFKVDALRWIYADRFVIAGWVVLLLGADVLALALVSTKRQAGSRAPEYKLREWWVLPRLPGTQTVQPSVASATDEINRRFNTWLREVEIPNTAGGLRKRAFPVLAVLRPSATGHAQVNDRIGTTSSVATSADTVGARDTAVTRRADRRREADGSKKHRQSRLAS